MLPVSVRKSSGSNLISFDPATNKATIIYPLNGRESFYTSIMGTHQLLKNGNRLIAETMAGRVFEIDRQGKIVWEYIKPYDDEYTSVIASAIRYKQDYFKVQDWSCQ